jgi:hypothetical protein
MGMVVIDGDYCTNLEAICLKSTYAPQNQKTICWDFQEPTECIGTEEHRRYCIDQYEYPNKKDELPRVMVNFPQAQQLCADQGKRICTESEWTMACEGRATSLILTATTAIRRSATATSLRLSRSQEGLLERSSGRPPRALASLQSVPSGSQPGCVSDYSVYDSAWQRRRARGIGNVLGPQRLRQRHHRWTVARGVRNQCRPKIYTHSEGFAYYYLSLLRGGRRAPDRSAFSQAAEAQRSLAHGPVPPQISPPSAR